MTEILSPGVYRDDDGKLHVDILAMEIGSKLPHWLSPQAKGSAKIDAIRAKHRKRRERLVHQEKYGPNLRRRTLNARERAKTVLPRTLYVNRPLLNADALESWARGHGFRTVVVDLHVTIAYSKTPLVWPKPDPSEVQIPAGGRRTLEQLGDKGAVVLRFSSDEFQRRWREFRDAGASWDWAGYKSHVTITYDGAGIDLSKIEPYDGPLVFGPEQFSEIDEGGPDIKEKWDESEHPRVPAGSPDGGQFGHGGGASDLVRITTPTPVFRVVPENVPTSEAFKPQKDGGVFVFTERSDAFEFQDTSGGKIVTEVLAPHQQMRVGDFDIELMHARSFKDGDPVVFANAGDSELYPAGTQLFVRDARLFSGTVGVLGRKRSSTKSAEDVDYIQDPATGRFQGSRPHGSTDTGNDGTSTKKKKSKVESVEDFAKKGVTLGQNAIAHSKKFIDKWNDKVGMDPEDFKKEVLGGVDAQMTIDETYGGTWGVNSTLVKDGKNIGTYQWSMDLDRKTAYTAYVVLNHEWQGHNIAKKLLAGSVDFYKEHGIERVDIHANIDVGGHAWARYGYVPSQQSWRDELRPFLERKLGLRGSSSSSSSSSEYTPSSWEEISSDDQANIQEQWARESFNEFYDSEVESWRDSGNALDDAKFALADNFSDTDEWAVDAVDEVLADNEDIPYTREQILAAVSIEEYQTGYEGRKDPEFTFDDDKLREPRDAPPPEQMDLPGIEPVDLASHLTEDMRDDLTKALTKAFNRKAERDADDIEPPDYLQESVRDYQAEYWDGLDDDDRYRQAERLGLLPSYDVEDEEDTNDTSAKPADAETDTLERLVRSNNPKAIWAIADHPRGKSLLLNSNWHGALNLKDPETMARFDAYVGNVKKAVPAHA